MANNKIWRVDSIDPEGHLIVRFFLDEKDAIEYAKTINRCEILEVEGVS